MFNNLFKRKHQSAKLFYDTDVHCHILPGVDHGAQTLDDSLQLIEAQMAMGIRRIVCTSHVTAVTFENTPQSLNDAFRTLSDALQAHSIDMQLFLSAEYRIDEYFNKQHQQGQLLPMPGNHLLLENSFQQELMQLDELLFDLQLAGYHIILAHPERYPYYANHRVRYQQLHNAGAKFQINILSLAGYFGQGARETALWLARNGMVDYLGSDMHNLEHAAIIHDYLKTKDWQKQQHILEPHIINDSIG